MTDVAPPAPSLPPQGWYVDPAGSSGWRLWSGTTWSNSVQLRTDRRAELEGLVAKERKLADALLGWMIIGVVLANLFNLLLSMASMDHTVATYAWVHQVIHLIATTPSGQSPVLPAAPAPIAGGLMGTLHAIGSIANLLIVAMLVVLLVFQHRAATAARAFGYPAKFAPSTGLWMWFIPVASLLLPYRALADCFAPDDERRHSTRLASMTALCSLVVVALAIIAIVHPTSATAGATAIAGSAATCAWLLMVHHVISLIRIDHEQFLSSIPA